MRIAYVVDVHDRFEAVEQALARTGPVDVLVVGGDITTAGSPDDAEQAIERWRNLAPTLLAVAGNMDSPAIDARLVDLGTSVDGRGVVLDDVGIAGASAAPHSPLHTPYEVPDEEFTRKAAAGLAELAGCRVRILCPHAPPHGTACDRVRSGEHVGSRALRALIEREQPDLVLCGHIHEARAVDRIARSQIVNPGPVSAGHYAVVEVDEEVTVTLDASPAGRF
jgi:Icc-related predicted phosphoesterase